MRIENTADIAAAPEVVWNLTTDVERWPDLTPTVTSVERLDQGTMRPGSQARILQPGLKPAVWTVSEAKAPRRFVWETKIMGARMVATHVIEPTATGCRNRLILDVSGLGAPVITLLARRKLARTLETENEGFRRAAESSTTTRPD